MKVLLTLMIVALLGSCSSGERSPAPVVITTPTQPATDEGVPPMPDELMRQHLARLSKQVGMPNLRDKNLSDARTEFRLWKGLGLAYPRCFVLKIDNGVPAASFAAPKDDGNKAVYRRGKLVYDDAPLNAPKSGWSSFVADLKRNGVDSSVNLATDERHYPDPDVEYLILEAKTSSRYTMAHYIYSTVTADGKKAYAVCESIEDEFGVRLACD